MPDQTEQPPKRMTTAEAAALAQKADQNATAALRVAQESDDMVAAMSEKITDLQGRFAEVASTAGSPPVGDLSTLDLTAFITRDQADGRIHEALAPLHNELHEIRQRTPLTGNLDAFLARLEEAERKAGAVEPGAITQQVATELHPAMSNLRQRVTQLEAEREAAMGNPVSDTLDEDALADQIQAAVDRVVQNLIVADDNARKRLDWLTAQLTSPVTTSGNPWSGTGAARKVLQLMRQVTHLGKEKEANLGQGGRFKFRSVDDAMDAVGYAMRDVGVILGTEILKDETTHTPITKSGTNKDGTTWQNTVVWTSTKLTVRYIFTDPEDGSTHPMEMTGEGRDASDKSTSKAASMALKYGLFQALMIPVTGLDDSDAAPPQVMQNERPASQGAPPSRPAEGAPAERITEQKTARARDALGAIRNIYRVTGGVQAQTSKLVAIMNQVRSEGLLEFVVEGSTLDQHGKAAMATLQAPPPPEETADFPPDQLDHHRSY